MEIRISVRELSRVVVIAGAAVAKKSTTPITQSLRIEADKDGITVTGTDLDEVITARAACEVTKKGAIAIPAKALADMVRVLPGPDVTLKAVPDKGHVEVKSGRTKAKLLAHSADDFPTAWDASKVKMLEVDHAAFASAVARTIIAASQDATRFNLNGIFADGGHLVATDGHRLARVDLGEPLSKASVILPRKGLDHLARVFGDPSEKISVGFLSLDKTPTAIVIRKPGIELAARLIDGVFPDYRQIMPSKASREVKMSPKDLLSALKRVGVMVEDKTTAASLSLDVGSLEISVVSPTAGEVTDDVAVDFDGKAIKLGINLHYLSEALASFDADVVTLRIVDELSPITIEAPGHLALVMPMRM